MERVSRRGFLRYLALSSGLLALSRLPTPVAGVAPPSQSGARLQVIGKREAEVLTAAMERMMRGDDPSLPPVSQTAAVATVDWVLTFADEAQRFQFRWLLRFLEWSPPLLLRRFTSFTALSPAEQDDLLRAWEGSRFSWVQLGFRALKNLSAVGYYSQDATWRAIGYRGPWIPRPARSPRAPAPV